MKKWGYPMTEQLAKPECGLGCRGTKLECDLQARITELEQERGAEGTNWFPESFVSQLQAQLQAVTQQYNEQFKAASELAQAVTRMDGRLQAVQKERDLLVITNKTTDDFANSKFGDVAQLQAHNKAMRKALEMLLGNERCPAWADKIIRAALRTEVPKP